MTKKIVVAVLTLALVVSSEAVPAMAYTCPVEIKQLEELIKKVEAMAKSPETLAILEEAKKLLSEAKSRLQASEEGRDSGRVPRD